MFPFNLCEFKHSWNIYLDGKKSEQKRREGGFKGRRRRGAGSDPGGMSGIRETAVDKNPPSSRERNIRILAPVSAPGLKRDFPQTNLPFSPSALHLL